MADTAHQQLGQLPGFRFHPTEEELLEFYLKELVFAKRRYSFDVIGFLDIYQHDPWDLPDLAKSGEREWYFFVARDRKHDGCGGGRTNRTTRIGYWKATGPDWRISKLSDPKRLIGLRKTLVFYQGRAPRGTKTDWVMNEYRLPDNSSLPMDVVLCKIYRKATPLKVLEQRAVEETKSLQMKNSSALMAEEQGGDDPFCGEGQEEEEDDSKVAAVAAAGGPSSTSLEVPKGFETLNDLQVPKIVSMDWTQDQFWNQSQSPWILNFTSSNKYT